MSDAPLHPIVIGAFSIGHFECLGDGLLHEGIGCEQPSTLKDLLCPTKTSKKTPIEDRDRPKKWWKAQCVHYGITVPSQAPISTYRVHLENAIRQRGGIKRPQEIADLEAEQTAKFRRLNAELRDATKKDEPKPAKIKAKATKPKAEPESEPAAPKPKAKSEAKAKPEPKAKEPKSKAEPKPKAETKARDKAEPEEVRPKAKEPKAKAEPKAKETKAKAEPKEKAEAKSKSKAKAANADADADAALAKPTASRKRKAETVLHIYHYDGDKAQQSSGVPSIPVQEEIKEAPRPVKKARKVAAPLQDHVPIEPPPYSEFDMQPSSSQPLSSQPSFSQSGLSQTVRKGYPGAFSGTYELECTSSEVRRSYQNPILKISILGNINTSFQGLLVLPDFLTCLIRMKPNAPPADDGYVRFEWCGRDDWSRETLPPNPDNVGWLKMYKSEGRAKGMIKTPYGEFLFQGPRVNAEPPNIQWRWADFDYNAMDVDGPYH
ncbi:hypothetical protein RhiJN_14595 [Ceratobasidium sp. AG-Ba]|nr:hypothetical protein RhiJN_14595 [Ceratobasidium sp. AG-Ba]QRW15133.1 hypothetical protein RhiLY_14132 [Ceratobasidium sp. AG-Ba]